MAFGDGLYLFCADDAPYHPLRCGDQYHPVTIDDEAEGDFVHQTAAATLGAPAFLGLSQSPGALEPEGGFDWVVPSTTGYTRWLPGQPNDVDGEDCATIGQATAGGGPEWVDYACQAPLGVVCEHGPPGLDATGWWDPAWPFRVRVTLSAGGLSVNDVPLLITIPGSVAGITDFAEEAADVRVVAPDGAVLAHDVDDWSSAADTLWLWVRLPTLDASLDHVDVYFGNYAAPNTAAPADVWQGYGGVWHFSDGGFDSSENGLDAITPVSSLLVDDGAVSDALALDGSTTVLLPKSPELEVASGDGISIELMLRRDDAVSSGMVLSNESCCQGYRIRSEPGSLVEAGFGVADCCMGPPNTEFSIDYTADSSWHHVVWVLDRAAHQHLVWVDGVAAELASMPQGSFTFPQLRLGVGVAEDGTPASVDELRVARRVLTSAEIDARWRSINGFLVSGLTLETLGEN